MGEEKTLIFCATDAHADMVKRLLDEAFPSCTATSYNRSRGPQDHRRSRTRSSS
jgi:type I restriction enzyme R subunit